MQSDEEVALRGEALGVIAALIGAAVDDVSRRNLHDAYTCLQTMSVGVTEPTAPTNVGTHRRQSDFAKLQELLMQLSSCAGVDQGQVIRTMMLVTRAESHWVAPSAPRNRFPRRRRTDLSADARNG